MRRSDDPKIDLTFVIFRAATPRKPPVARPLHCYRYCCCSTCASPCHGKTSGDVLCGVFSAGSSKTQQERERQSRSAFATLRDTNSAAKACRTDEPGTVATGSPPALIAGRPRHHERPRHS